MYHILVAEDEGIERLALCKILRKHFGEECIIHEARNGREALELALKHRPQTAILDVEMPSMSGLEAAREIRMNGVPCMILFLTAFDRFDYAREAISLRALDYLLKPYEERELILSVEEALRLYEKLSVLPAGAFLAGGSAAADEEDTASLRLGQTKETIEGYILEHYTEELSMQDVAKAVNYSDAYFCKLFKQCFKVNFSTYLNEFRVAKAREMLGSTRLSVREVSRACGYSDANYFARVFKRITGKTPSEFRVG